MSYNNVTLFERLSDNKEVWNRFGKHISELNKLKIKQRFSKPVLQLDMNNNVIREFSSATEAEHYLKVKGSHISCCCTGKRKIAYGYKWRYE